MLAVVSALSAGALVARWARADTQLLARVGTIAIDVDTFTRRASRLAAFQWAPLGAGWAERRRRFLEDILIPEALLDAEADRSLGAAPRDGALSRAMLVELQAELSASEVPEEEIARYYDRYRRYYEKPRSILLWRILVREEVEARELIDSLREPKEADFGRLARERSIDLATHMRAGVLGFVAADGQTHLPQVRVAPALFAAADRVKDGAIVPEPVREGDAFAVIWRRSSRAAEVRSLAEASPEIRARVREERTAAAIHALTERLRQERLGAYQPDRLLGFAPEFPEPPPRAARTVEPSPVRPVRIVPEPTERGLR